MEDSSRHTPRAVEADRSQSERFTAHGVGLLLFVADARVF
jgi:hypothetical protein